jgi:hypothetical protein
MKRAALLFITVMGASLPCGAYSALSHEAVVDAVWLSHIRPLLLTRFPGTTPDQLKEAHAFAYGGSQIQDMGYFPFASHLYSDLTHYVRSGDFVVYMIRDAQTADELAFALGALAHYTADRTGHPAVNRSDALEYPKLRRKFGNAPTYEDNPADHLKTEFAFDVVQVSRGLYAPDAFRDFIGFQVSQPLLERAFADTYGFPMKEIFGDLNLGIGTYRWTMGSLIPEITKVAWDSKRADIETLSPAITRSKFVYDLPRREYRRQWHDKYRKPGIFTRILAFFFRAIPTVGPFRVLAFRPVPDAAERDFLASFDQTVERYRAAITEVRERRLRLADDNLDTGQPTRPGAYRLADRAYAQLIDRLAKDHFTNVPPDLRKNILAFYAADTAQLSKKSTAQLNQLKAAQSPPVGVLSLPLPSPKVGWSDVPPM